jgi:hypothetical protein
VWLPAALQGPADTWLYELRSCIRLLLFGAWPSGGRCRCLTPWVADSVVGILPCDAGCEDDAAVVEWLVKRHRVCLIPGSSCGCPGHVSTSDRTIINGMHVLDFPTSAAWGL